MKESCFDKSVDLDAERRIYVITQGAYSDYHICAATTDFERAEKLRQYFEATGWESANIEEFPDGDIEKENTVLEEWRRITCSPEGIWTVHDPYFTKADDEVYVSSQFKLDSNLAFTACVRSKDFDGEKTMKIMQDTRAAMIAKKLGL